MRLSLSNWIGEADALRHLEDFKVAQATLDTETVRSRSSDLYLALTDELFEALKSGEDDSATWARLANGLAQFGRSGEIPTFKSSGVSENEADLFAAIAFYVGGFPASAYLIAKACTQDEDIDIQLACIDLLGRPRTLKSTKVRALIEGLHRGDSDAIGRIVNDAIKYAKESLLIGPTEWVYATAFLYLLKRFLKCNIRAVLPEGNTNFWDPLVASFLIQTPPKYDFFPSQIGAIEKGLLDRQESFALQMPTGAGKTDLCETLIYSHLQSHTTDVAVLLVPYRSLASELRGSLVKRLNSMGLSARCSYGGTVPSGDEVTELVSTRAMIATPESLSALLSADQNFFNRISLVICDEGHLLDDGDRGVGLELLLARLRTRKAGPPRMVFMSAIVPNIEEINGWLGGTPETVVRSEFRAAVADFSVLRVSGSGAARQVALAMHPHEPAPIPFSITGFLESDDFRFINPNTQRKNTYPFSSIKCQAIAAARKALAMGAVAVFAANKRGAQGAMGLVEELLSQLDHPLSLPKPVDHAELDALNLVKDYLAREYGDSWIGTRALAAGAVLHHGDIPQETREVIEGLIRNGVIKFAVCTSTLAEGVNLPIRTLVLYSINRRVGREGQTVPLLARDIKNLVGRAGRAGSTTKGLVICANEAQWGAIEVVAKQGPGERVVGALRDLLDRLREALAATPDAPLTNENLEATPALFSLIDGVDATLIELAAEELGEEEFIKIATDLSDQTFASTQVVADERKLLQDVFELRAKRMIGLRAAGRLDILRTTGARPRMLDLVEAQLLELSKEWTEVTSPLDEGFLNAILGWAWNQPEMQRAVRDVYRIEPPIETESVREGFVELVKSWLAGERFVEMAVKSNLPIDDLLRVQAGLIGYELLTAIEQGLAILGRLLESAGSTLVPAVVQFPNFLRFGISSTTGLTFMSGVVRHRVAAVKLSQEEELQPKLMEDQSSYFSRVLQFLELNPSYRDIHFGSFVAENTLQDLRGFLKI